MRYCKRDGADKNPNEGFWLIPEIDALGSGSHGVTAGKSNLPLLFHQTEWKNALV